MVFDYSISPAISLSTVLDCFITEGEPPSVILPFLRMHVGDVMSIFRYSMLASRFLCLANISKMKFAEVSTLSDILVDAGHPSSDVIDLHTQVMSSKDVPESYKSMFRRISLPPSDVYDKWSRHVAYEYDMALFGEYGLTEDDYVERLSSMKHDALYKFAKRLELSSWGDRVMQCDIFSCLPADRQWVLVEHANPFTRNTKTYIQLLDSDLDTDVKREIYKKLYSAYRVPAHEAAATQVRDNLGIDLNTWHMLMEANTFSQVAMNLEVTGNFRVCKLILFTLLVTRGLKFLKGGAEHHRRLFDEYFNIHDLLGVENG